MEPGLLTAPPPRWALVVEPDLLRRQALRQALLQAGYEKADAAETGREGVVLLNSERYRLVVANWRLPDMDGLAMLEFIAQSEPNRGIPLVLAGEAIPPHKAVEAIKAGIAGLLPLPVHQETLDQLLANLNQPGNDEQGQI